MNRKLKINLVITDLDDTIWDWLKMWHSSFVPYLDRISKEFNLEKEVLKKDFKKIHQKYGSTEFSFIYKELDTLSHEQKNMFNINNKNGKSILHEYYSLKKNNLFLYPSVLEALKKIKEEETLIVGFTESNAFFTKYRLKHLNLDGIIDYIYAPIDTKIPESVYQHYTTDYWEPEITEFRYLAKEVRKPAPEILEIIIKDFNAIKEETIYIGDKLDKDIYMANEANIISVYAKYGHHIDTNEYQILREITHWSDEDVEREKEFKKKHTETPIAKYSLDNSFDELFKYFNFERFKKKLSINQLPQVIDIWKKTVDVQQHFNDIALRIRNIALTVFTFIIGGIGYLEKEHLHFNFIGFYIPYSMLLALTGVFIMFAFFYMDRFWYHNLLLGAVKSGLMLEKKWEKYLPEIKLAHRIGESSPHKFFGTKIIIHSRFKFYIFYGLLGFTLLILIIGIFTIYNKEFIWEFIKFISLIPFRLINLLYNYSYIKLI